MTHNSYLAAQIDKMELLRNTPTPRLILIGGSNLAFSVNSPELSRELGFPVVNMGLHGGLGLKFMLDRAKPLLRKGDFVVVMPEYEHFVGRFDGNETLLNLFLVTHDTNDLMFIKPLDMLPAILDFKPIIHKPPYTRDSFNGWGDVVVHLSMADRKFDPTTKLEQDLDYSTLDYLANFMHECDMKGIRTVYTHPCLMATNYTINSPIITEIDSALRDRVTVLPGISLQESVYDDNYFFNNRYHMNSKGRSVRTGKLLKAVNNWVNNHEQTAVQGDCPRNDNDH